ncbi:hypothetical protein OG897_03565 [Streptomyces sp. NBC_00237]|uniref:hypothetical protein n=1 Tax=Streptomyces sp. NBC_00237 TaxID=2975687 RepID=UPI00225273E2|nr:hypothetical protein [Streptomyces sp. NBC_00237]MCX5200543.1 hypothetical protein [Streptomyces sp. NBC_00237]
MTRTRISKATRRALLTAATAALCATTLTSCGTQHAGAAGAGAATGKEIVCPDGSTPGPMTGGGGEDLTSEDVGGTGEDLTSEDVGGTGEDLTSEDVGGTGEDLTSEDVGGTGEDLTSEDVGGTGEDLTSDPGTGDDGLPEGPSECWGPDYGKNDPSQEPHRVNGVPTVGAHRWYGMKTEFTAYIKSTPSTKDDEVLDDIRGIRMVKIRRPENSDVMEARIASGCGPFQEQCEFQAKTFADWRSKKYGDKGHVVLFGGAKTTVELTWGLKPNPKSS